MDQVGMIGRSRVLQPPPPRHLRRGLDRFLVGDLDAALPRGLGFGDVAFNSVFQTIGDAVTRAIRQADEKTLIIVGELQVLLVEHLTHRF